MTGDEDRDLRDAFHALGGEMHGTGPTFAELTSEDARRKARQHQFRRRSAILLAAIVIPALFVFRGRTDRAIDYERFTALTGLDLNSVTWEAPSDFLLDVPGRDLLRGVPMIEVNPPAFPPDSVRPPVSNDTQRRSRS